MTIRNYVDIGLFIPDRSDNDDRRFREPELHKLTFSGRARALGFTIESCPDCPSCRTWAATAEQTGVALRRQL